MSKFSDLEDSLASKYAYTERKSSKGQKDYSF